MLGQRQSVPYFAQAGRQAGRLHTAAYVRAGEEEDGGGGYREIFSSRQRGRFSSLGIIGMAERGREERTRARARREGTEREREG